MQPLLQPRPVIRQLPAFPYQLSITGKTGVGTTSLTEGLKKSLNSLPFRFVSGGGIMRAKASELGMTIEQFARHNHDHPEDGHDKACDAMVAHFAEQDYLICEGRLPHFFMPRACRVLLTCLEKTRAERRVGQEGLPQSALSAVLERIVLRDRDDDARYVRLYPGCLWSEDQFDIVVRTDHVTKDETLAHVLQSWSNWRKGLKL